MNLGQVMWQKMIVKQCCFGLSMINELRQSADDAASRAGPNRV